MHRALPLGKNMDHWIKLSQDLHHSRLKSMKPSIDNKQPKVYSHLQTKKKREQLMLERYSQIEKENRILLEKMAEIMGRPTYPQKQNNVVHFKSLNAEARRRRLKKITEENQQILKRIQASGPNYDHRVWEQHWQNQQMYLKNLCEYPCILLDETEMHKKRPLHLDRKPVIDVKPKPQSAPLQSSSPTVLPSLHKSRYASTPDLTRHRRKKRATRRRKQKPATTAVPEQPVKIVLREGRNIDGIYVIVSVLEFGGDTKKSARRRWQYKVYDPQFAEEISIDLDYEVLVNFAQDRPELLLEARQSELAALTISRLHVDSSSGRLRAGFGSELVPVNDNAYFDPSGTIATDDAQQFEEDEFGSENDLKPQAPSANYEDHSLKTAMLQDSPTETKLGSDKQLIEKSLEDLQTGKETLAEVNVDSNSTAS